MARELLPGESLLEDRYEILRTLCFKDRGGVYEAVDVRTGQRVVLKELIAPPDMTEERLELRRGLLHEAMEVLSKIEDRVLVRLEGKFAEGGRLYVVMERAEGISLETVLGMSVKGLPEKQVLAWGERLARTLAAVHDRPRPYLIEGLEPAHVLVDTQERLKLVSLGLGRVMEAERPRMFAEERADAARDVRAFGRLMFHLLTRRPDDGLGFCKEDGISPETERYVNLLLTSRGRSAPSFEAIAAKLHRLGHPREPESRRPASPMARLRGMSRAFGRWLRNLPLWKTH